MNFFSGNNLKYYNGIVLHKIENEKMASVILWFGYQELLTMTLGKTYIEIDINNT